jgi:hypothetical protein
MGLQHKPPGVSIITRPRKPQGGEELPLGAYLTLGGPHCPLPLPPPFTTLVDGRKKCTVDT